MENTDDKTDNRPQPEAQKRPWVSPQLVVESTKIVQIKPYSDIEVNSGIIGTVS
ncbi:MAG: hypothetical protein WCA78_01295 [Rhizomicrobium sp.]